MWLPITSYIFCKICKFKQ